MRRLAVLALGVLLVTSSASHAQVILLREGSTLRTQVAPNGKIAVPIVVDLANGAGTNVSALTLSLNWASTRLTFDSVRTGGFGSLTSNTSGAATGALALSMFDASGTTSTITMATVYFTAAATPGGTRLALNPTVAGDDVGNSVLPLFRLQHLDVCVATSGLYGDSNGDANVNIIDAQQIARFSVSLSVANIAALNANGDVTADGNINIIDAQQIARYSVALSAAARVNTSYFTAPALHALALSQATGNVNIGGALQLASVSTDASSGSLAGCYPVTWSSNQPGIATVDSTGRVVGVGSGSATITAAAGGKTATASITVGPVAGAAASIVMLQGDQQWAYASASVPVVPQVLVKDAALNPVPNVAVTFTASAGTFNGGAPLIVNTDANGLASAANWVAPSTGATATMTASAAGGLTATATANILAIQSSQATCIYDGWSSRCWGLGTRGQLGNGTSTSSSTPVQVSVGATSMKVATRTAWGDHFCGLDNGGVAYCWGWNSAGQLGDGTRTDRNVPTVVSGGLTFRSLATGSQHTCGVTTAGDVYCWGVSTLGQLGDGSLGAQRLVPAKAGTPAGVVFTQVAAGANYTCATTAGGDVYCWGINNVGQLGDGTISTTPRATPAPIAGSSKFPIISASPSGACGLTAAGAAYCWGGNANGQLGNGTTANSGTPVAVQGGFVFSNITSGNGRSCGERGSLGNEYTVWCWGFNGGGLGDGTSVNRPSPTLIPISLWQLFHGGTGIGHACGLEPGAGQVFCWGANTNGQLGNGGTSSTASPDAEFVIRAGATVNAVAAIGPDDEAQSQSSTTAMAVPIAPSVQVGDGNGTPLPNVTVTWTVLSGGGVVANPTSQTNPEGRATSGSWTLGPVVGMQILQATVSGVIVNGNPAPPLRQTFIAYGTQAPALAVKISGDSTWNATGTQSSNHLVPMVVKVTDGTNPIPNVSVTYALGANSGSLGASSSVVVLTDANGLATLTANEWIPTTTGTSTLTATVAGMPTPLVFTHFMATGAPNFGLTSCELTNAGAAMCAGMNSNGTVGDGTTTNRSTFVPVSGGLTFTSLAEGVGAHKCALVGTTAYCWGYNGLGQLGDGSFVDRNVPTAVSGGLAFSKLSTQGVTTCGLTTSSQVYCWGWAGTAGWGIGESQRGRRFNVPTLVNAEGNTFTKIAVMDDAVCGLTGAGAIKCRGRSFVNGDGTTEQRVTFSTWSGGPWSDLSTGNNSMCSLDATGLAFCLGSDQGGALGIGTGGVGSRSVPTQTLGGHIFASIHVQNFRACARRSNGELYCWGINNGTGSPTLIDRPTLVPGISVTSIRQQTFRNTCVKIANGQLYCWGPQSSFSSGTVGDGSTIDRLSPVAVVGWPDGPAAGIPAAIYTNHGAYSGPGGTSVTPIPSVAVKDRFGNAVAGVTVTFTAPGGSGTVTGGTAVTNASGIATVGSWTLPGTLGSARLNVTAAGVPQASFVATVIPPPGAIAITAGNNQYIPDFSTNAQSVSVTVLDASNAPLGGVPVTFAVAAGNGTISGGSSSVATTNAFGVATLSNAWAVPTAVGTAYAMTATASGLPAVTFTARRLAWGQNSPVNPASSQCRLTAGNVPYCWGGNSGGSVGDGTFTGRTAPTAVSGGFTFAALAKGPFNFHNCGLTSGGQAYCWGNNDAGQLGNNTQTNSNVPVAVSGGLTFASLATGPFSTCGITTAGAMYCWGWGAYSHRGDGELYSLRLVPALVNTGGRTFVSLSIGMRALCALDAAGQAFCWGENFSGHLGNGNTASSTVPVAANTPLRFASLGGGFDFTCGLVTDNTVACWGFNGHGQLGTGNLTNQSSPTLVPGLTGILEVRSGESHSCARTSATVHCWGFNGSGNVGDGTLVSPRSSPVQTAIGVTPLSLSTFSRGLSCVATSTQLYCWGGSPFGVGDGTGSTRTHPTAVIWPDASTTSPATTLPTTPSAITAAAGDPQTVTVQVKNAAGTLMPNVTVNFVVTSGGGTVTAGTVTAVSGIASTAWALAGAVGTVGTLEVRVTGIPTVVITGTVVTSAGAISVTSGNNQWLPDFFSTGAAPTVTVLDGSNAPSVNTTVTWTVGSGSGTISTTSTNTNANGVATMNNWVTPPAIGTAYTLQASAPGLPPVTFTTRRLSWGSNGTANPVASLCRLNSSGAAYCWGGNLQGQVGDGTNTSRSIPTAVAGGLTFTSMAKGSFGLHQCALTAGGQAYCWGSNEAGQLGNDTQTSSNVPVLVSGGHTFSHLAVGGLSTCGITTSGGMYCWGWGSGAQMYGIQTVPTALTGVGNTFVQFTLGLRVLCALTASGQAFCYGENYAGQLGNGTTASSPTWVATSTALRFTSLAAGHDHVCGLTTTNTVACWGSNNLGTVGNGTTTNQTTPLLVTGVTGAFEVRSGEGFSCARTTTQVHCWGANTSGQLADGTFTSPRTTPVVSMTGVAATALPSFARSAACATTNTQMYCWGGGPNGIGDNNGSNRNVPTAIRWPEAPASDAATTVGVTPLSITGSAAQPQTVTVQARTSLGVAKAGVSVNFVVTSGGGSVNPATVVTDANGNASTSWTLAGGIGSVGTVEARVTGVPTLIITGTVTAAPGSITITGGNFQNSPDFANPVLPLSVTVFDGSNNPMVGATVTWAVTAGSGTIGTTAVNTGTGGVATLDSWIPPAASGTPYTVQASVPGLAPVTFNAVRFSWSNNGARNPTHAMCRLNAAGAAYCWGGNAMGAVGDGSFTNRTDPALVSGGIVFASLAKGGWGWHNCGLTPAGKPYCWGSNEMGQLGNGTQSNSNVPVAVTTGLTFTHLATGPVYSCGITTGGAMYCWGWGGYSLRGDNEIYGIRNAPALVNTGGRTFVSLAAGMRSLCAIDGSGQAFCWGENFSGNLGNGNTTSSTTPVATLTDLRFTSITAGFDHTCGLTTTNTVACWGYNGYGVIGNGTTANQTSPLTVPGLTGALDVQAGETHNCARTSTSVYCWGINGSGQIGDGTTAGPRTSPVLVASGVTPTSLVSFARSASCMTTSTQMYCWGNSPGGIGDGTFSGRNVATAVRWPEAQASNAAMTVAITPAAFSTPANIPTNVIVRVRNALGAALAGVTVNFVVTSGGGSVDIASGVTDDSGNVVTYWTLQGASGTIGKLEARVAGNPSLVFTGTVP